MGIASGISLIESALVFPEVDSVQSGTSSASGSADVSDTVDLEGEVGRIEGRVIGRIEGGDDTPIGLPVICSIILRLAASRESVCVLCCSWIIFFSSVCMILLTNSVSSSNTPPIASLFDGFDLFGKAGNPSDDSELTILFISSFGQRSSLPVVKISSLLVTLSGLVKEYLYPNILGNV